MIFFRRDPATQTLNVADMRMNGSCAGGTGAFIDEIASILKVPVEEFNELASQGSCIYDISGRCGVYAKTDIQPLLNQGISRQDLALSSTLSPNRPSAVWLRVWISRNLLFLRVVR